MTASKKHEDCAERANFGMNFVRGMMPTTVARAALIALCAAGFPLLSACSSDDDINLATYVEQTEPADVLYKSMVMGAFAQYRQGNYPDAINTAKRYVTLYPTSPDAAYAQYIVGLSYYRQIRDVTQDQKPARQTIEAMDEVVQRWPDSEYVEDARPGAPNAGAFGRCTACSAISS